MSHFLYKFHIQFPSIIWIKNTQHLTSYAMSEARNGTFCVKNLSYLLLQTLLLAVGFQRKACFGVLCSGILRTWLYYLHRFILNFSVIICSTSELFFTYHVCLTHVIGKGCWFLQHIDIENCKYTLVEKQFDPSSDFELAFIAFWGSNLPYFRRATMSKQIP